MPPHVRSARLELEGVNSERNLETYLKKKKMGGRGGGAARVGQAGDLRTSDIKQLVRECP